MNFIKLSKEISYALRHAPWEYELELDEEGWVSLEQFLAALNEAPRSEPITINHLQEVIKRSEKKRFEIADDTIRALYGHSTPNKIVKIIAKPPIYLYHGTARRFLDSILSGGITPQSRQYVHLSADEKTALLVGKRRDDKPILLRIAAKAAWNNGTAFYRGSENVWLTDHIDPKYIEIQ